MTPPRSAFSMVRWTLAMLLAVGLMSGGCGGPLTFVVGVSPGDQRLKRSVVQKVDGSQGRRVALIDVSGVIANGSVGGGLLGGGENPVSLLQEQLNAAAADRRVKAVVLRINSPGGGVTASDAMYRMVKRFRATSGKPVVAMFMDVAASGGYYLGCAADEIVAYPSSVTGSIGVIFQTVQFQPAMARLGINADAITSGPNKDAGSPLSSMTPEQRETLEALVVDYYENFVAIVRDARPSIDEVSFAEVTDGRIVSGERAMETGLVDSLGDVHDAVARAEALAGIGPADWVMFHRPLTYSATPYSPAAGGSGHGLAAGVPSHGRAGGAGTGLRLSLEASLENSGPGFFYLWTGH